MSTKPTANDVRLLVRYEEIRKRLLSQNPDRLMHPLAYFVLEGDRRLPLVLLHRSIQEIVSMDFVDLASVPGIGSKKLEGMILVLERAAASLPQQQGSIPYGEDFQSQAVSEEEWAVWRAAIVKANLQDELLGRFAPSLEALPRVIWDAPLSAYTECSLSEIRSRKTHGEKRVRAVLEVFAGIYSLIGKGSPFSSHLAVQIVPKFLQPIMVWIANVRNRIESVTNDEVRREFVEPMVAQVRIDAGDGVRHLVADRLGLITGQFVSVRESATRLGLTRARVYQLLGEVAEIMLIRWPNGFGVVHDLRERLEKNWLPHELSLFSEAAHLFFPNTRHSLGPDLVPTLKAV